MEKTVFTILKRAERVYVVVPDDLKTHALIPIIKEKVVPGSVIYTDGFKSYDVRDVGEFKHECIDHDKKMPRPTG